MTFDGIITSAVIQELNKLIIPGKIEKITMPNSTDICFTIYSNATQKKCIVLVSLNPGNTRINIINQNITCPASPYNFCMVLRKHLLSSKLISITQYNMDRIIELDFETYDELNDKVTKSLIIELMGKYSNCILIDNNKKIIDCLHKVSADISSIRMVLPGLTYEYPPTKTNFTKTSFEEFKENIQKNITEDITIANYLISTYNGFSNQFISTLSINAKQPISELSDIDIANIYNNIAKKIKQVNDNCFGVNIVNEKDIYFNFDSIGPCSINQHISQLYAKQKDTEEVLNLKNHLLKIVNTHLSKANKNLNITLKNLKECEKMDTYKLYGELITANYHLLRDYVEDNISLPNYYNNNEPLIVPLDKKFSPQRNAQKYFKKYTKLKNTYKYNIEQKEILENEINYLESIAFSIDNSNDMELLNEITSELIAQKYINEKNTKTTNKKDTSASFKDNILKYAYLDYTIYVGKNNLQNEYITHKLANKNDIWLHVKSMHGSHVIIQTNQAKNIDDRVILLAAQLAAFYSKAKNSSKVDVDYCPASFVKKHPSKKTGMVIYTDYMTITIEPKSNDEYICK